MYSKIVGFKEGDAMKLSTKGRYGLRALVDLALHEKEGPVSLGSIAKRQDISEGYLEQLMRLLKKAELVESVRGVSGGYRLKRDSGEISVGEVLRALEGEVRPVDCSGFSEEGCSRADQCVTKYIWKKINDSVQKAVDDTTLKELLDSK